MGLVVLNLKCNLTFTAEKTNTGFPSAPARATCNDSFNLRDVDLSVVTQAVPMVFTNIAPGATQTVDLRNLTNLVGETVVFTRALGLMLKPVGSGSQLTAGMGATQGLSWLWTTGAPMVMMPGGYCFAEAVGASGTTVTPSNHTLDFRNTGGSTMTSLTIYVWGKTS